MPLDFAYKAGLDMPEERNKDMEEYKKDMHIMKNFDRIYIYTHKIDIDSAAKESDLWVSQIKALFAFNNGDHLSMKELADNVGVKVSEMATLINSLIKNGMAEQSTDDKDRKKVKVRLTSQGKKIRAQLLAHQRKIAKAISFHLSDKDKVTLLNSLDTACRILKKIS